MLPLAILAGIAQALGSVLGKFAFGSDSLLPALANKGCLRVLSDVPSFAASCWMVIGRMHRNMAFAPLHPDPVRIPLA